MPVAQNAAHAAAAFGAIKAAIAGATATFAEAGANTARTAEAALDATVGVSGTTFVWEEILADVLTVQNQKVGNVVDLPLWLRARPQWANIAWAELQALLPDRDNWDVWIDWYEERLRGGSPGEAYELVFASVPQEEWEEGPAAANAWIKAHLPKPAGAAPPADLPEPVANAKSPWTYALTAKGTVTVTAGAQSFPFYPYFNSEQEHHETLHACGVQAQRLLTKLLDGRYHNVRPEYAERLANYLDDLPKTAEDGSVLVAYGDILNLRSDFEADFEVLPTPLATDLRRVIENQFALNSFYDIVERHNEAIASGTRSRPFPKEAIRPLREFISKNTPRYFEPNVSEAERSLDRASPKEPSSTLEDSKSAENSDVVQLTVPQGTPDAKQVYERQTAANANAIWEVVVKGPAAIDGWWHLAHQLGGLVRPFLDYLR